MKRFLTLFLTFAILFGLCACGGNGGKKAGLQVGFGRASTLPDEQVTLAGGDANTRKSQGYMDEIFATCIAMTEGDETILMYTLDTITILESVYAVQEDISAATGIPTENIILNATHDHSSPSFGGSLTETYKAKFTQACITAATDAIADQSAAEIYYGSTHATKLCFVRHYILSNGNQYGTHQGSKTKGNATIASHAYDANDTLQVIKFARAAEDKKDIVLMNMGAHPNIAQAVDRTLISADWPGYARAYVEENTDSLCAVFLSAAGDQGQGSDIKENVLFTGNRRFAELGEAAGKYCVDVLNGEMAKAEGSGIKLSIKQYTGKANKEGTDNSERMAQAVNVNNNMSQHGSSHVLTNQAVAEADLIDSVYEAQGLVNRSKYPDTFTMDIHALTVGGISFIFAPYEMFGESSQYIMDNSPYGMTFIVSCSENPGGHMGYIPSKYGCENSFYEYDVTKFATGTAEDLAKTYVEMLTELQNAN